MGTNTLKRYAIIFFIGFVFWTAFFYIFPRKASSIFPNVKHSNQGPPLSQAAVLGFLGGIGSVIFADNRRRF